MFSKKKKSKSEKILKAAKILENQKRSRGLVQTFDDLFVDGSETIRRITASELKAGKRVLVLDGSSSKNKEDESNDLKTKTIVLDSSLTGVIKLYLMNLCHCTLSVHCKLISGTMEMIDSHDVTLKFQKETSISTLQIDKCHNVDVQFHSAPSAAHDSQSKLLTSSSKSNDNNQRKQQAAQLKQYDKTLWGNHRNDRIFYAGVTNLKVTIFSSSSNNDEQQKEEEEQVIATFQSPNNNNATEDACRQFVISRIGEALISERVVGSTSGRPMTQREVRMEANHAKRVEEGLEQYLRGVLRFNRVGADAAAAANSANNNNNNNQAINENSMSSVKEEEDEQE